MIDTAKVTQKKQLRKFNSTLSFPHKPPYEAIFAERVPVLQAFQCALGNYLQARASVTQDYLGKLRLLLTPSAYPFRAVECGVYTGSSLLACGLMVRDANIPYQMIGLDTFCGLPALSDKDRSFAPEGARYLNSQVFMDTSIESVQAKIIEAGLDGHIELRQGLFSETLSKLPEHSYHFVNIDCDLYEPHIECLEYFYPRMVKGGVVFFDDYHSVEYPMAKQAIDHFMQDKPEQLLHLLFGNDGPNITKSFFVKY